MQVWARTHVQRSRTKALPRAGHTKHIMFDGGTKTTDVASNVGHCPLKAKQMKASEVEIKNSSTSCTGGLNPTKSTSHPRGGRMAGSLTSTRVALLLRQWVGECGEGGRGRGGIPGANVKFAAQSQQKTVSGNLPRRLGAKVNHY